VTGGRWAAERYAWERIVSRGAEHDHAFVRSGQEVRTAVVVADGDDRHVMAGVQGLRVLKTTGAGFEGYPKDRYTTLAETRERILATEVTARWRYSQAGIDYDATYADVRALLLEAFAERFSTALQATLFEMGRHVLEERSEIAEIRFSMPNNHHILVDLSPFGLDNPSEVFYAADRPYGLIEATVLRDGAEQRIPVDVTNL
jgi:urate oxidase